MDTGPGARSPCAACRPEDDTGRVRAVQRAYISAHHLTNTEREAMKITLPFQYIGEIIPPRCRKPRRVTQQAKITLTLHDVSADDAPVAIIEREKDWEMENPREIETIYRWWHGKLWTRYRFQRYSHAPYEVQTAQQFHEDPYPYHLELPSYDSHDYRSLAERRQEFRQWAAGVLFIDGERWQQTDEPRYVIMTFGLGHNHGIGWGTSLSTDHYYNSNISRDRYFRVDRYQEAVAETQRIALARGDTKALPVEQEQHPTRFDILIPEAIRLKPLREHGRGCDFINSVEAMIENSPNSAVAGMALTATADKLLGKLSSKPKRTI